MTRDRLHPAGYAIRLADAQAWRAQAFVSLHSDIRGTTRSWKPDGGAECLMAEDAPGFSVLYSVEGDGDLTQRRAALAEAVAKRMLETGFSTYGGAEYSPKYDSGPSKGTFIDRHPEGQRIMVLRQATMPSVIIETHNALDPREAERWTNRDTIDAFASAVTAALVDTLTGQP